MRYLKSFCEEVSYTYGNDISFLKGLEDVIEGIFVELLDDGWVLDYQLTDYAGNIGWVKLRKSDGELKTIDQLLPYLHHFYDYIKSKGYDFHHIDLYGWICVDYDRSKPAISFERKDWDFIEQHLIAVVHNSPLMGGLVGYISMNLSHNFKDQKRNLKSYNESLEENDKLDYLFELQDFCETSLVYLLDKGYEVSIFNDTLNITHIELHLGDKDSSQNFYWNDVKDYYIPFLQLLSRRYKLDTYFSKFHNRRSNVHQVFFNADKSSYCSLDKVINDDAVAYHALCAIVIKVISKI